MSWIDVTVPIRPGMPVFEGDPPVVLERVAGIASGGICNLSRLDFGLHSGTHVDAPLHFLDGAPGVEAIPIDALLGLALVVDATSAAGHLGESDIDSLSIPHGTARVLFKTRNSRLWDLASFSPDFVGLTEGAARLLVERGVRLVGIDYLSIAPFDDPVPPHTVLLDAGVVILEGLDLRQVAPGAYEMACLPLLVPGADGAPARTLLRPLLRQPPATN